MKYGFKMRRIGYALWIALMAFGFFFGATACGCGNDDDDDDSADDDADDDDDSGNDDADDDDDDSGDDDIGDDDSGDDDVVNEGDFSIDDFDYEDTTPEDFHPLTQTATKLVKTEEIALVIPDVSRSISGWVLDDEDQDQVELGTFPNGLFDTQKVWDTASGSVDEDGFDEVVTVSTYKDGDGGGFDYDFIRVRIVDYDDPGFSSAQTFVIGSGTDSYINADIALADVDGDGVDEIVVAAMKGTIQGLTRTPQDGKVFVYDDADAGFALLETLTFAGVKDVKVAAGEMDGDRPAEIAVIISKGNAELEGRVYDDADAGFDEIAVIDDTTTGFDMVDPDYENGIVEVAVGDFDADGIQDVALGNIRMYTDSSSPEVYVQCFNVAPSKGVAFIESFNQGYEDFLSLTDWAYKADRVFQLLSVDMDGDGLFEIVSMKRDYDDIDRAFFIDHMRPDWSSTQYGQKIENKRIHEQNMAQGVGAFIAAGDDDHDFASELYTAVVDSELTSETTRTLQLRRYTIHFTGTDNELFQEHVWTPTFTTAANQGEKWITPFITVGDFDGDNLTLKYTGERWLSLPNPMLVIALASPPMKDGISQDDTFAGTTFGTEVSQGAAESHELGVSTGVTISYESPDFFDVVSVEASASMEWEFSRTATESETVTYGTSYATAAGQNYIIFQGTLYNCFKYEVLAAPDPDVIGTFVTIDVPVDTKLYKWTADYFNDTIEDSSLHLGEETFPATIGDPAGFPTQADATTAVSTYGGWMSPEVTVGQGLGFNTVSINLENETTTEDSRTLSTEFEAGVSVAGVGFSGSRGYSDTEVYSVSVGESTAYEGAVGDIEDTSEYTLWNYAFGLYVYNFTRDDGVRYQVVNYWTDDLAQGYDE